MSPRFFSLRCGAAANAATDREITLSESGALNAREVNT